MDTLESMQVFVRVVELGSFAAAARGLDLSPAMVSKHIAHLEGRTGARLLNRTTRHVRPTEAGATYFEQCTAILRSIDAAEAEAGADTSTPRGTLRITAPTEFGNLHLPLVIAAFLERHPAIDIALDLTNRSVDIVQEGYDLAIRIARDLDTSLVGRRIALSRFHIVASPAYLAREGHPVEPAELARRHCLTFAVPQPWTTWAIRHGGEARQVKITPRMLSTSAEALLQAARAGVGIGLLPTFVCGEALARGELVSLFPDCECGVLGIYILFPHRALLPARVRLFIDFLVEAIGGGADRDPWEFTPER
ncbi:LysR family transcriptional regulator [Rhizobium sp. KAs_5_22]|uniref:LysR family transcriptional regulator n=1 Tax=Ciceribacter selenitireducens TaxID=448181 RepID=UPI0004AE0702|nr:LysR family transcriptional regulator [Ciceribacter selenitireducens]PPJ47543.1 LysR family transcriptional regulator [Rhizobium sp. KAs_5_22]